MTIPSHRQARTRGDDQHARGIEANVFEGVRSLLAVVVALAAGASAWAGPPGGPPGGVPPVPGAAEVPTQGVTRSDEPVLVEGAAFPDLLGRDLGEFGMFRWDPQSLSFVPIPFQIDERYDRTFNPGVPELEFVEKVYDVFGEEDGRLDEDDELAFMYQDVGFKAPPEAPWPEWADPERYEIAVEDPRPGSGQTTRWVYLYTGASPPRSDRAYVSWAVGNESSIETELFALDYEGNWLMTGYRVFPPCGDGSDLIDRMKGRARPLPNRYEDEEGWSGSSTFLGGIVGPVRAIRYVRGAQSGVNTIHHDIVYDSFWFRKVNLRVHPIVDSWLYVDWRSQPDSRLFTPEVRDGVVVDGAPDPQIPATPAAWHVMTGARGGIAVAYEIPPSDKYGSLEGYYRDDADYDDTIPENPEYGDDDDAAIGAFGNRVIDVSDTNVEAVTMEYRAYPLCSGEGNALVGDTIDAYEEYPLEADPRPQSIALGPVRGLSVRLSGADVVLSWDAIPAAEQGYRVYASDDPSLSQGAWTRLGDTSETEYVDPGAANEPTPRFYSVVGLDENGDEGPW
jgi:hypothetical protein